MRGICAGYARDMRGICAGNQWGVAGSEGKSNRVVSRLISQLDTFASIQSEELRGICAGVVEGCSA